jgi:RimK family alpha-L-glutamate ligase
VSYGGLRVGILGPRSGWHTQRLAAALAQRGHDVSVVRVTSIAGRVDGRPEIVEGDLALQRCDAVLVRGIPAGSLEQIIFRVDALHLLEAAGVTVVNGARAIERTVDKFLASALLARAGVATPRTVACQSREQALRAFEELGGDVIVKPLFGAMGLGMARVQQADIAARVFRALELERAVFYLQETIAHEGRDVRALVIGGAVLAAMERFATGWRVNLARGARARAVALDRAREGVCVRAAAALGAEVAGVDLLRGPDGRDYVVEVNGIPGWQGLEGATGIDVTGAVADHVEALATRDQTACRSAASSAGPIAPV